MFSSFDARKSWQKATKFREHLSFINTQQQPESPQQPPPNTKSAWSPITPSESGHGHLTLISLASPVPPVPPIPAIHASHLAPVERDPDEQRSIDRARAEAAAALERGSRERQAERERLDRERQKRLLEKERQQQQAAASSFFNLGDDSASGRGPVPSLAPSSFTSKSKAAWERLSRAVFRFTSSPAAEPSYPFPRDSAAASSYIPRRLSDLSPWPPLNVSDKEHDGLGAAGGQHHYAHVHSRSHSRAESYGEQTMADHAPADLEKGGPHNHRCPTCHASEKKRQRKSTVWCILLFVLILALIGNVVFLNIRVLTKNADVENPNANSAAGSSSNNSPSSSPNAVVQPTTTIPSGVTVTRSGTATATSSASAASGVPAAVSSCLSQFASTNSPASYPCSQCVPILSAIPNDLSSSSSSSSITGQGNVLQFCALQAVNAGLPSSSSSALTSVGWLKDTKPCAWQGVSCDSQGRINALELVAPGVPSAMPDEMQFLVGLTSLKVTGDNTVPSGSLASILSISSLQSLDLEQTGLQASMDDQTTFSTLSALKSLTLVKNAGITIQGNSMAGITGMGNLKELVLNFQSVPANALDLLTASSSNPISSSLSTLSLSNSNQAGSIPAALPTALPNLMELHLDGNAYSTLPTNGGVIFPSKTSVISLKGNSGMSGTISSAECQALQKASSSSTCDFSGTAITLQSGVTSCGNCVFGQ